MPSSTTQTRRKKAAVATSMLSILTLLAGPGIAEAGERVGVASAVTPMATSKPPGAATQTLKIGKSVFYNERITTSGTGVVQVLLVDGSTFTVGPRSNLLIDKFVYDPHRGAGEMTATLSKGALRFVGGKLSKQEPAVKVKTPAGELTIRGGIFQGIVKSSNQAVFAFVFGDYLALNRNGRRYKLRQSGNLFAIGNAGPPVIRPTTAADANLILAAISGRDGGRVYKVKGDPWPFYYGIQPTGRYPDQPFIRQRYYDNLPIKLRRVPEPKVRVPHVVRTPAPVAPQPVRPPAVTAPAPRPTPTSNPQPPILYDTIAPPSLHCANC